MKKTILVSLTSVLAMSAANASGFYVSPKLSWGTMRADESRVEKKVVGSQWAEFAGNKHESWDGKNGRIYPKFAVGYDFETEKYGIFGIEAEYSQSKFTFDIDDITINADGKMPNKSGYMRHMSYADSIAWLNAKYGYKVKYVTPFITAGIGYGTIDSENQFHDGTYWWDTHASQNNVTWNIGAGIEVPVAQNIALTLAYNYVDLGKVEYSNMMNHETTDSSSKVTDGTDRVFESSVDLVKHELTAGVKIMF